MAIIAWNEKGNHKYSTGVDHVTLFVEGKNPVAWDGVTAVNEAPSGAEVTKIYADNIHYFSLVSKEEFGCTVECYGTPDAFDACNGIKGFPGTRSFIKATAQERKSFVLAYRVANGTDKVEATNGSYTYHFVFGCKAGVASRGHATVNDSPEAATLSFEISTTPVTQFTVEDDTSATQYTFAHVEVEIPAANIASFEEALFNTTSFASKAITLADIIAAQGE